MSEAQWYVVHTYSGYENKVKVDIEKTIENRGLQDPDLRGFRPVGRGYRTEERRSEAGGTQDVPGLRADPYDHE